MGRSRDVTPTPVEEAFFRTVAAALSLSDSWKPSPDELDRLRSRMLATEPSSAEATVLASGEAGADRGTALVALRATEALAEVTRTVAAKRGLPLPERLPEAIVVCGTEEASTTRRTLERQASKDGAALARTVPALIVADDEAHAALAGPAAAGRASTVLADVPGLEGARVVRATQWIAATAERARAAQPISESKSSWNDDPMIGQLLGGKYLIKQVIGKGGFGTVFLAEDKGIGELVAIKILNERASRAQDAMESFFQEAKLLTKLDHSNIVRWLTFDRTPAGLPYFVMEYLQGKQLDDILKEETLLPWKRVAEILLQVLDALRAAHELPDGGLLHLDLKPNNVLVLRRLSEKAPEKIKVIDFGISQSVGAAAAPAPGEAQASPDSRPGEDPLERSIGATVTAETLANDRRRNVKRARGGTLLYASPEQCEHLIGKEEILELDRRSDLYSLGIMAFRMLIGRFPFDLARTREEIVQNHLTVAPHRTGKSDVKMPRRLAAFVDKCLEKDREKRWADAAEAYRELDEIVHPKTKVLPIAAGLVLVLGGPLLYLGLKEEPVVPTIPTLKYSEVLESGAQAVVEVSKKSGKDEEKKLKLHEWRSKANLPESSPLPELVLVSADGDEQGLAGWHAKWADDKAEVDKGIVHVYAQDVPEDLTPRAILKLKQGESTLADTDPFGLKFIDSWEIGETAVQGLGSKQLHPAGQKLTVQIISDRKSAREAFHRATLYHGDREVASFEQTPTLDTESAAFTLPLDTLADQPDGKATLRLEVWDEAGHKEKKEVPLTLCNSRIQIANAYFRNERGKEIPSRLGKSNISPKDSLIVEFTNIGTATIEVLPQLKDGGDLPELRTLTRDIPADKKAIEVRLDSLQLRSDCPAFTGIIVIRCSDDEYVHPKRASEETRELGVSFEPRLPQLTVKVEEDGVPIPLSAGEAWNYFKMPDSRRLKVVLARDTKAELLLQSELTPGRQPGGDDNPAQVRDVRLERKDDGVVTHDLGSPGEHHLLVRAFPADEEPPGTVLVEEQFLLFLEDAKPGVQLRLDPPPKVVNGVSLVTEPSTSVIIEIASASPLRGRPSWRLEKLKKSETGELILREPRAANAEPGSASLVQANEFAADFQRALDGEYELTLTAENVLGRNSSDALQWQIAYKGPEISEPIDPKPDGGVWGLQNNWVLRAIIDDPNDISDVTAKVVEVETSDDRNLPLGAMVKEGQAWRLESNPAIDIAWSERTVRFEITARDMAGNSETKESRAYRMPKIEPRLDRLLVAKGDPNDRMLLIEGNAQEYRALGTEEYLAEWELGDDLRLRELKDIKIEKELLPPYYLDAHEVTVGQFLRFVEDEEGYQSAKNWPDGHTLDTARHAARCEELRSVLHRLQQQGQEGLPVTGIDAVEAGAFARSRGKRLPTLLEWEFAVRGREYRHTTIQGPQDDEPKGGDGKLREAAEESDDFLEFTLAGEGSLVRLRNLVSNVSEWTCTPSPSGSGLSAQALLRPSEPEGGGRYMVAGAS